MSRRCTGLAGAQRSSGGLLDGPAEADLASGVPASAVAADLRDDLLYGSPSPHHDAPLRDYAPSGAQSPSGAKSPGGWFGDPTAGVDEHGRPVGCRSCGAPLSQPRIDYGLTTCRNCREHAGGQSVDRPAPAAAAAAIAVVRQ